nr:TonB family protein [Methylobacterium sp. GC_Met_2]
MKEAPHSTAPVLGTGESARRIRTTWQKQLLAHLERHKRYPGGVGRPTGQVTVTFMLDRLGRVVSASVVKGSGDIALDDAALAMMKRSDPVPPPPPLVADEGLTFSIPVVFRAKK